MEHFVGVRKGAWTEEEDILLKQCIETYGERNWHQIPQRAGLNRCRKSCRLRWLNYLNPYIKRGEFGFDEVDLIIRMHNLLGNRWSLIAGRLPGRTANDIKNYWNTHIIKKYPPGSIKKMEVEVRESAIKTKVLRPQPCTFPKNFQGWRRTIDTSREIIQSGETSNDSIYETFPRADDMQWLESVLFDKDGDSDIGGFESNTHEGKTSIVEEGKSHWSDLCLDASLKDLWEL